MSMRQIVLTFDDDGADEETFDAVLFAVQVAITEPCDFDGDVIRTWAPAPLSIDVYPDTPFAYGDDAGLRRHP